jgi:glycosyltransferase involved in cell wall biosynthesis
MRVLLLIPAFNEERTIGRLVDGAKRYVSEVLVVDDGSDDATHSVAAAAGARVYRFESNMGKGEALKAGFRYAIANGYDGVVTMDGDGQHNPQDIANFLTLFDRYDLILGNRMEERSRFPSLRLAANFTSTALVSLLSGHRILDSQTGFRFYSSALLKNVHLSCSHYDLETEVIIKAARGGFRIGHCRIHTIYAGEVSRFRSLRDSVRFLQLLGKCLWNRRCG